MHSSIEEEMVSDAEIIAAALRAFTARRPIEVDNFATCLEGPLAHEILYVTGLERIADRAFVLSQSGEPCTVALSELYHSMDFVKVVQQLMDEGKIAGRIVN